MIHLTFLSLVKRTVLNSRRMIELTESAKVAFSQRHNIPHNVRSHEYHYLSLYCPRTPSISCQIPSSRFELHCDRSVKRSMFLLTCCFSRWACDKPLHVFREQSTET